MKIEKDRDALRTGLRTIQYASSLVNHVRPTMVQSNVSNGKVGFKPGKENETSFESDDEFIVPVGRPSLTGEFCITGTVAEACMKFKKPLLALKDMETIPDSDDEFYVPVGGPRPSLTGLTGTTRAVAVACEKFKNSLSMSSL